MTGDKNRDPVGAWEWVKGPRWWRECPALVKAGGALTMAFMAGVTTYALLATQLAVPVLLGQHGERLDTLESKVQRIEVIVPMVEADHILIQSNRLQLDSMRVTLAGVWCIMQAETHGLDPLRECFVPRPTRNGNGDNGGS